MKRDELDEVTRRRAGQRLLDRKTKELFQIVVEAATPREILEALEAVIMPMGGLAFRRGVQAWAAETGFQEMT